VTSPRIIRRRTGHRLGGYVYGLVIVGGAFAIARPYAPTPRSVFADAVIAVLVYSMTHGYVHVIEQRVDVERPLTRAEMRRIMSNELVMLGAITLPVAVLVVTYAIGASLENAVTIALWVVVVQLGVTTWLATYGIGSWRGRVLYSAIATGLGLALIVLKVATH
jgi:VIT1/CCC1 family predicted Fe2+/Mn2+ transporter